MRKASFHFLLFFMVSFAAKGLSEKVFSNQIDDKDRKATIDSLHNNILNTWLNYPEKAMKYGREALSLSQELRDSFLISKSLRLIAGVHYYKGDYEHSLDYNLQAFEIAKALQDSSLINNGYNNIGLLYYNLGSYEVALEYLLRSISIKEKTGETYGRSTTLNNIGLVFDKVGDFDEARKYFAKAYEAANGITKRNDQLYSTNNMGLTYLSERKLQQAMKHFREGLAISKETNNKNWGAVSLRGIGAVFLLNGALDSAHFYLIRSLENSEEIDDKKGISESRYWLAQHSLEKGNYEEAIDHLKVSQEKATQLQQRQQLLDNLKLYAAIYANKGDTKMENVYLKEYIHLRDSLFQKVVLRNLRLIPLKLKEEEDRLVLAKHQAYIKNQKLVTRFSLFALVITLPLVFILIVLLRKNNKKKKEIEEKHEELQQTQKLLIATEKMASLGVMAAGIAHEINNPLNFIKNGVEALTAKFEDKNDPEVKTFLGIVNQGVDRATTIVKSLSHFSRKGDVTMNQACNIHEIIGNCLLILHNKIVNKVRVLTDFSEDATWVKGNEGKLHQVMMNIIANAIQAIKTEGTVKVTTRRKGKMVEITVEDDGEGIPTENLSKISDPFFTTKPPGEGTGLGLFISYSIIEEHGGEIIVESIPGKGTKFIIKLPGNA